MKDVATREVKHFRSRARVANACAARAFIASGREKARFARLFCMVALPDGDYDVFVIDAEEMDDASVRLELTITSGAHKGELIALRASNTRLDALMSIGIPGTLHVVDGVPRVELEA